MTDWNRRIIEEFRANEGRVGGNFGGHTLLLLHHTGARTGTERVNPLACQVLDDDSWAIFASKGGAPTNPDWYRNLLAHPKASIEFGTETIDVVARVVTGEERTRIWNRQIEVMPGFAEYDRKTERDIPVIVLDRVA